MLWAVEIIKFESDFRVVMWSDHYVFYDMKRHICDRLCLFEFLFNSKV